MRSLTDERRTLAVRVIAAAGLLAGVGLSLPLWLARRSYPPAPLFAFLPTISPPWDAVLVGLLGISAVLAAVLPKPRLAAMGVLVAYLALVVTDQTRLQPWAFEYALMFFAVAFLEPPFVLDAFRFLIAGVYLWSGFHKLNASFVKYTFPWLMSPLRNLLPERVGTLLVDTAIAVPFVEMALGIGLLFPRTRRYAVVGIVAMHTFLLATLSPWGLHWNSVVWPWNAAMILLVLLLFPGSPIPAAQVIRNGRRKAHAVLVLLVGILPPLSAIGWWDHYLGFALYSGNSTYADILLSASAWERLDAPTRRWAQPDGFDYRMSMEQWAYLEMNTPSYPAERVFRRIAEHFCSVAPRPEDLMLELVQDSRWAFRPGWRRSLGRAELCDSH